VSGKIVGAWIASGVLLLGAGVGLGYVLFRSGSAITTSPASSPSPIPSVSPSPIPSLSPSPSPTPTPPAAPEGWSLCTNPPKRFSIGYPGGWVTRNEGAEDACGMFDPENFDFPREGPSSIGMVVIGDGLTVDQLINQITAPEAERKVLKKEETKVGDRRAVLLETEATGRGDETAKSHVYEYVIDRNGKAFNVRTYVEPNRMSRYAEFRSVIDQAVKTLKFF
jgi:hypothetical protein